MLLQGSKGKSDHRTVESNASYGISDFAAKLESDTYSAHEPLAVQEACEELSHAETITRSKSSQPS